MTQTYNMGKVNILDMIPLVPFPWKSCVGVQHYVCVQLGPNLNNTRPSVRKDTDVEIMVYLGILDNRKFLGSQEILTKITSILSRK